VTPYSRGRWLLVVAVAAGMVWGWMALANPERLFSGRWRGELPIGNGRTSEVFLDIGRLDGRWIGECDYQAFGLTDFTLAVAVQGPRVRLDFGGADASFDGRLSSATARIAGTLSTEAGPIPLEFERVGAARLSEDLVAFERTAADSTRLVEMDPEGGELRAAFNRERDKVRLVALLSPT